MHRRRKHQISVGRNPRHQSLHTIPIQLMRRKLPHNPQGLLQPNSSPVRTVLRKCAKHIRHRNNPRFHRKIPSRKPIRISRPIQFLVVFSRNNRHLPKGPHPLQNQPCNPRDVCEPLSSPRRSAPCSCPESYSRCSASQCHAASPHGEPAAPVRPAAPSSPQFRTPHPQRQSSAEK